MFGHVAYVVPLLLVPVERLLGPDCAIAWSSLHDTVGGISTAPTKELIPRNGKYIGQV